MRMQCVQVVHQAQKDLTLEMKIQMQMHVLHQPPTNINQWMFVFSRYLFLLVAIHFGFNVLHKFLSHI